MCPVVVWCDCVGDLQWRTGRLPCRGPTLPHPAAERGAETRETYQCSLCHRDVSVHSKFPGWCTYIVAVSYIVFKQAPLYFCNPGIYRLHVLSFNYHLQSVVSVCVHVCMCVPCVCMDTKNELFERTRHFRGLL